MRLRWLGHAAFSLEVAGLRLCIDPHAPGVLGGRFDLPAIAGPFDAIVNTHPHEDHLAWRPALGTTRIIDSDTTLDGPLAEVALRFRAVPHDRCCGAAMGWTRMVAIAAGGLRIVHAGDIGAWGPDDAAWIGAPDALLVPVGGTYTLDGPGAVQLLQATGPRHVVPMHAADPRVDLPLAPLEDFLSASAALPEPRPEVLRQSALALVDGPRSPDEAPRLVVLDAP